MDILQQFLLAVSGIGAGLAVAIALIKGGKDKWPDDMA